MLTELEKKILKFIGDYLRDNDGRSPTLNEIGNGCGLKSVGTIHRYLTSIEQKGFLDRAGQGWRMRIAPNELPYLGKIAAGIPIEAIEHPETIDLTALLLQPDCYVLNVEGDSMIDRGIFDSDLVVIKSTKIAQNGDIVVAIVDNEATLKEIKILNRGKAIEFIPHNIELELITYQSDEVVIRGVLMSVIRMNP